MKKLMIVGDRKKERINKVVDELREWFAAYTKNKIKISGVDLSGRFDLSKVKADFIVVLGGDGSILSTARRLKNNRVPVIGVNLGKFGFLAEYSLDEFKNSFAQIISGLPRKHSKSTITRQNSVSITPLMMLSCEIIRNNRKNGPFIALNDMVITRGSISRMVYFRLFVDGKEITVFGADGVIISTPVGSTAYSLSAGGPIISPGMHSLIINPICAHTLSMRPLVVPANSVIELEMADSSGQETTLTVDGQISMYLRHTDKIVFKKGHNTFQLVRNPKRSFYETLREKLFWGGQPHSQRYVTRLSGPVRTAFQPGGQGMK